MNTRELLAAARQTGLTLIAAENGSLRVRGTASALNTELVAELSRRKRDLLPVVARLQGMRETFGRVPVPCAVAAATGGPGRCFSCGARHREPSAYGRCEYCQVAADAFYAETCDPGNEVVT